MNKASTVEDITKRLHWAGEIMSRMEDKFEKTH